MVVWRSGGMRGAIVVVVCGVAACLFPDVAPLELGPSDADAGAAEAQVEAEAGPSGPCSFTAVQAVPGTTLGQVMHNTPTSQQTIVEAAGDLLVVVAYGGQHPGSTDASPPTTLPNMTFSVSDTLGNTYFAAPMIENARWHQAAIQIFYAPNVIAGTNTVTVTSAAPAISLWTGAFLQEYAGAATTDAVDFSSGQTAPASTTGISPPPVPTARACELVVGGFTDGHVTGQSLNVFPGWVKRSTDDWDPGGAWDSPDAAPMGTSVAGGMYLTSGPDDGWVAEQIAFRGVNTSPLPQPDSLAFATPARSVTAGSCSQAVVVQSQHGTSVTATATGITATLSGPGLTFAVDPACAYPMTKLFIGAGANAATFYFKGASAGAPTITVSGVGSPIMQTETVM